MSSGEEGHVQDFVEQKNCMAEVPKSFAMGNNVETEPGSKISVVSDRDQNPENSTTPLNDLRSPFALSFSGCGFLGCYHFGVVNCFNKNGKSLMLKANRIAGSSMGSMVAALLIFSPDSVNDQCAILYTLAEKLNNMRFGALSPGFNMNDTLRQLIDTVIPEDISAAQDRLYISVTHQMMKTNRLISVFPNRDYLIDCLLASCYIPVWSGSSPPALDGEVRFEIYIDGGYTENLPTFKDMFTLTVSPFSGDAVICPHDQNFFEWRMKLGNQTMKVNMHNVVRGAQALFPPTSRTLHAYYEMGFRDAMRYLLKNGHLERIGGTEV
ncbi:hypothetical protein FO519_003496 [Halicephalobus sp. NKZ332]|nr:hypothetical protein FO519_003496 [Halicephalobus sp. NKZ332]